MSRYDLRWATRHPGRWLSFWWLHATVAAIFVLIAVAWTDPVFERVLQPNVWPVVMGAVASLVVASALAPFERRLQAVVGATLVTLGITRAAAMVDVWSQGEVPAALLVVLGLHALLVSALGTVWPEWTLACGTRATVEAGREGTGG